MSDQIQCQAHTRKGHGPQCSRNAVRGSQFCYQHTTFTPSITLTTSTPMVIGCSKPFDGFILMDSYLLGELCQQLIVRGQFRSLLNLMLTHKRMYLVGKPLLTIYLQGEHRPPDEITLGHMIWRNSVGQIHRDDDLPAMSDCSVENRYHMWYRNGQLHRDGDQPAVLGPHGRKKWYRHGQHHREGDQPAVITPRLKHEWWVDGFLHREGDQPAVVYLHGGQQEWYRHGQLHRDGDQPALITADGRMVWYQHGKRHREGDRPAVMERNGLQEWYQNGLRHREDDQPAMIRSNGRREWWVKGRRHRDNKQPAMIYADGTCEWWSEGILSEDKV